MDNDQLTREEQDEKELRRKERKEKKKKKRRSTAHLRESTASHASVSEASSSLAPSTVADAPSARSSVRSVDDGLDPRKERSSLSEPKSSPRKTAAASSNTDSLNQMEQDVLAKSRARPAGNSAAARYARKSAAAPAKNNGLGLTQLEQDVLTKNQGRSFSSRGDASAAASSVGASSTTGGQQHGKASGRQASSQAGEQRSSLRNLEEEIAVKTRANDAAVATRSPSRRSEASRTYEADEKKAIAATSTGGANGPSRSSLNSKPRQQAKPSPGQQGQQQSIPSLQQMEEEVIAKRQGDRPVAAAAVGTTAAIAAANYNAAAPPASDGAYARGVAEEERNQKMKQSQTNAALAASNGDPNSQLHDVNSNDDGSTNIGIGVGVVATADDSTSPRESALPSGNSVDIEDGGIVSAEIEAFVADNFVDATGVAVVMSEAEEERLERKKHRKYCIYGIACFILVAIGIVLAVVFTVGQPKETEPLGPTTMPSISPSTVPSFAPTTTQLDGWIDQLIPFSGEEALRDISTPQYRAALWLADEDELQLPIGDPRGMQRYFLATFYFALDGDNWVQCGQLDPTCGGDPDERSWLLDTEHECDWLGVGCDITATIVTSIFFPRQLGNGLKGTMPLEVAELTALETLILQNNDLMGTLPTFLSKCKQLSALFLLGNQFVGSIPSELLTGATMLGTIHFGGNQLTGTIPPSIATLPLRTLNLANNHLEGSIPDGLGQLTLMSKYTRKHMAYCFCGVKYKIGKS
jgi:hypothetical protein